MSSQTRNNKTKLAERWLSILLTGCATAYLLGVVFAGQANAQAQPHPGTDYPKSVDPWEVILYEQPNFTGRWITYKMEPGMRQKFVQINALEQKVSSVQVGSMVCVQVFDGRYFQTHHSFQEIGLWGVLCDSLRDVHAKLSIDTFASLIVFPKTAKGAAGPVPLGVWMHHEHLGDIPEHITFFPLPEWERDLTQNYGTLGWADLDKNSSAIAIWQRNVSVTLYDDKRMSITLPGAGPPVDSFSDNLGKYGWTDRAVALAVSWTGPPPPNRANAPSSSGLQQGVNLPGRDYKSFFMDGGPEVCEKACAADPNCKAFTWVKAGVQGPKAACWLKSAVPPAVLDSDCVSGYSGAKPQPQLPQGEGRATFTPDISGKWHSSNGTVYKITQSGAKFAWDVKQFNEQGSGTLTGVQISASWSGDTGTGLTTGKVIVDASGQAIRIEWNSGAVFVRQ